jgi:CRP/FNR family transcriptional regulator, cyclic AMP receptor protein
MRPGRQGLLDPKSSDARISVPEADPDLLKGLDEEASAQARAVAHADLISFPPGPWEPSIDAARALYGLFIVDGLLSRGVVIEGRRAAELLGPGDVLRPYTSESTDQSVSFTIEWEILQPTSFAVLDRDFADAVAPWPEIAGALMDRMVGRAHALAFHLAVSHLKLVETRLVAVLWYYADRWGRVTPEGRVLPVRFTHALLARVVGARRPSVSTALGRLQDRGLIDRLPNGHWLLLGGPPSGLHELGDVTLPLAANPIGDDEAVE